MAAVRRHRRRLCRRAEGAGDTRHLRQNPEGRRQGGPDRQARRRAVRDRPRSFRHALEEAKAQLAQARITYDNLVANIKIYGDMLNLAQQGMDLKQRDVERKQSLVKNNYGSQLDLDNASNALVTAGAQAQYIKQQPLQCQDAIARQPRVAAGAIPGLRASESQAGRCPAQPRPHRAARADGWRGNAGRADPARPLRRRRHAGVLHHRRRASLG